MTRNGTILAPHKERLREGKQGGGAGPPGRAGPKTLGKKLEMRGALRGRVKQKR